MVNSNSTQDEFLPRPETDQASGNVIDLDNIGDYLLFRFNYPGKASGQQVDFTASIKPDRWSDPVEWGQRLTTQSDGEEVARYKASAFHYTTQGGTLSVSYKAVIGGQPYPSSVLLLSIKDRIQP